MRNIVRSVGAIVRSGWVLALAGAGCAQVAGIDDWSEAASGGGGNGGSGGSWTSSSGQAGNGTAGSTSGGEICANSIDDDGDGLTDCADSDCGDFACVAPAPAGWEGPVEVLEGDVLPACRDGWASSVELGGGSFMAPAATCAPCSCGSASGGSCLLVPGALLSVFPMGQCSGTPVGYTVDKPFECYALTTGTSLTTAVKLHADVNLIKGGCQSGGGDATVPELFFEKHARACQPPALGAGCGGDGVCMSNPIASNTSVCIYTKDLAVGSCPPEYPNSRLLNAIVSDTRGCSACTCADPVGQLCGVSALLYGDPACAMDIKNVPNMTCDAVGAPHSFTVQVEGPNGGVCAAAGGQPIGAVDLDTMIVCCL